MGRQIDRWADGKEGEGREGRGGWVLLFVRWLFVDVHSSCMCSMLSVVSKLVVPKRDWLICSVHSLMFRLAPPVTPTCYLWGGGLLWNPALKGCVLYHTCCLVTKFKWR